MHALIRLTILAGTAAACLAQQWEIGGLGGGSFLTSSTVNGAAGAATAGFRPGPGFGAFFGNIIGGRFGGEMRYMFLDNNLKLSSGGSETTFSGVAHVVHYDFVWHTKPRERGAMPYLAGGGGIKVFCGTGSETAYQPLSQFAYLTKTQQVVPLISVGGGVKFNLSSRLVLRAEVRDYLTPFPNKVIAPAPGATLGGWLHNIVPIVGVSLAF
jgi:hypothetical protein